MSLCIAGWDVELQWLGIGYKDYYGRKIGRQRFHDGKGFAYVVCPIGFSLRRHCED